MSSLEVEVSLGHIRAIPVTNPAGEIMGWSFRESGAEVGSSNEGSVTSPAANTPIVALLTLPVGVYTISWEVQLSGTVSATDLNNFKLLAGVTVLSTSLNAGAAGQYPQTSVQFQLTSAQTIQIQSIAAGTVGAVYAAQLAVAPVTAGQAVLELQDGNSALCEISAGIAGSLTQWFGPEGIRFYNQIKCVPVLGQMVGAVYARFGRAHGYT